MTHTQKIEQYIRENRPVSGGKGDSTVSAAEKSQAGFQSTLQNAFATQFANQQGVLKNLTSSLTAQQNNPQGFTNAEFQAANSNAINTTAAQEQNAIRAAQNSAAAHGGGLPSGVQEQVAGQIAGAGANQLSGELNQIQEQSAELANQNYWNATKGLEDVGSLENPNQFAASDNSAASSIANLSEAETASDQSQLLGALGGIAGGVGAALSKRG